MLTPLEIRNQEFDVKMRGYDRDQVDDFLYELSGVVEDLVKEQKDLQEELNWALKKLDSYDEMQDSLNKSIIVAQDAADQLKENSQKEADVIIADANNQASEIMRQVLTDSTQLKQENEELRKQSRTFRQRLQIMLDSQLELLQNQQWDQVISENESQVNETYKKITSQLPEEDDQQDSEKLTVTEIQDRPVTFDSPEEEIGEEKDVVESDQNEDSVDSDQSGTLKYDTETFNTQISASDEDGDGPQLDEA